MINSIASMDYKSDKHPVHDRAEKAEKELRLANETITHLLGRVKYLEEKVDYLLQKNDYYENEIDRLAIDLKMKER